MPDRAPNLDLGRKLPLAGLARPLTLAWGLEVRRDAFETGAGDAASYQVGPLGACLDLSADLTRDWQAKLSTRFALDRTLALRGAVSSNFRAPSLAQQGLAFTVTDRVSQRISRAGLAAELAAKFGANGIDGVNVFTSALDTRTRGADLVTKWTGPALGGELRLGWTASFNRTTVRGGGNVGLEEINTLTDGSPRQRHARVRLRRRRCAHADPCRRVAARSRRPGAGQQGAEPEPGRG